MTYYTQNPQNNIISDATQRVIDALDGLENKLQQRQNQQMFVQNPAQNLAQSYQQENAELLYEQEKLQATIVSLTEQYGELQNVAATIYDKLDNSIERLAQILERP